MESRLVKPSMLKKPTIRTIVPTDRLIGTQQNATARQPLTMDLLNLPATAVRRLPSPDIGATGRAAMSRPKLRRSRSACEMRPNIARPLAAFQPTLAAFKPSLATTTSAAMKTQCSKLRRSRSANDLPRTHLVGHTQKRIGEPLLNVRAKASKTNMAIPAFRNQPNNTVRPALTKSSTNLIRPKTNVQRPATVSGIGARKAMAASSKSGTAASAAATTTTTATAGKRIPAYDFKARFLDLSERHKLLKDKYDMAQEKVIEFNSLHEQHEDTQAQLYRCQTDLKNEKVERDSVQRQLQSELIKSECLSKTLNETNRVSETLRRQCLTLTKENETMRPELNELRTKCTTQSERIEAMTIDLDQTRELLFLSNMERKELHNAVMDLRGNIRVFCRVRPPLADEQTRLLCGWQYIDESSLEISHNDLVGGSRKLVRHDFSFDQVFHPKSRQEDIFELVSPLIQSALDGFNVCIFAYGQTGSGKTYTMDGVPTDIGIIPRTVDLLFETVRNYKLLGWLYQIRVTFMEIYNEQLYDLLSNDIKDMDIRMVSAKNPTDIYVSNITEVVVESADHLRQLMALAKSNRATASTVGNERSSRSHAVTRLQLIGSHSAKQETCVGTINLVDLAGSESPKTSIRMEETKKINKSLSELTNVIMALLQRHEHIPYRNSKLTHLLMPCLGGNSKTLMFINVAPFQDCFSETVKSLRFAASVNSCKMTKVKKNKFLNTSQAGTAAAPTSTSLAINSSSGSVNSSHTS